MSRNRDLLYAGLAVLAVTALCLPLILVGPQKGSSIFMNLPWANGFAEQVLQGELYPRWLEDLNAGAGSPVFFFYGPVPFYFTTIGKVLCVDCSVVNVLGIGLWLMVVGSATSFFVLGGQLAAPASSAIGGIC